MNGYDTNAHIIRNAFPDGTGGRQATFMASQMGAAEAGEAAAVLAAGGIARGANRNPAWRERGQRTEPPAAGGVTRLPSGRRKPSGRAGHQAGRQSSQAM